MARQTVYLEDVQTGANHAPPAINAMLDEGFVCQLGLVADEQPVVILTRRGGKPDAADAR